MKKEKLNIVVIDVCYYPVPTFVTDWIKSEPEETDVYEDIPEEIIEYFGIDEDDNTISISTHFYENDRALILTSYATMFESISELNDYFIQNNYEMGEEFHYEDY